MQTERGDSKGRWFIPFSGAWSAWSPRVKAVAASALDGGRVIGIALSVRSWRDLLNRLRMVPPPATEQQAALRRRAGVNLVVTGLLLLAGAMVAGLAHGGAAGIVLFLVGAGIGGVFCLAGWSVGVWR